MNLEQRVEALEKEVSEVKQVLTSVNEKIIQLSDAAQFAVDELRARLDAMS
ncbi:hypothetical protein [Mixta gaviniae]|uniref:hypothetical protein n=1 Tax=Mixta gaviniae TaxID=665914 RepID=UPI00142D878C|nr:hypothetical protein [Mixta gaviniae]